MIPANNTVYYSVFTDNFLPGENCLICREDFSREKVVIGHYLNFIQSQLSQRCPWLANRIYTPPPRAHLHLVHENCLQEWRIRIIEQAMIDRPLQCPMCQGVNKAEQMNYKMLIPPRVRMLMPPVFFIFNTMRKMPRKFIMVCVVAMFALDYQRSVGMPNLRNSLISLIDSLKNGVIEIRALTSDITLRDIRNSLKSLIDNLKNGVVDYKQQIRALTSDITLRDHRIDILTSDITLRDHRIDILKGELIDQKQQIKSLTGHITLRDQRIYILKGELTDQKQQIKSLTGHITLRDQRIDTLERTIKHHRDMYESLALQPYMIMQRLIVPSMVALFYLFNDPSKPSVDFYTKYRNSLNPYIRRHYAEPSSIVYNYLDNKLLGMLSITVITEMLFEAVNLIQGSDVKSADLAIIKNNIIIKLGLTALTCLAWTYLKRKNNLSERNNLMRMVSKNRIQHIIKDLPQYMAYMVLSSLLRCMRQITEVGLIILKKPISLIYPETS